MDSMSKSAFSTVGASSKFGEVFAELRFVFERVGLRDVELIIIAITFGGGAGDNVAGFLVNFEHLLGFLNFNINFLSFSSFKSIQVNN